MFYFDLPTFIRLKAYQVRHGATVRPWMLGVSQLFFYPLVHVFLGIDRVLRPGISRTPVREPIFIVGLPRSGTTFLLSLLAADPQNACYTTWELIFPSPTMRNLLPTRFTNWAEKEFKRQLSALDPIHPIRPDQPEEDEALFLLLGNSALDYYFYPYDESLDDLAINRFWEWPDKKKQRFLEFYHSCLQRLLWSRGATRYVGKNPHASGRIEDLLRMYPDARFIHLLRSPLEAVPSALSMISTIHRLATGNDTSEASLNIAYRMLVDLRRRASAGLNCVPAAQQTMVRYEDLITNPHRAVASLYAAFHLPVPARLESRLAEATRDEAKRQGLHRYKLEEFGLEREQVLRDFTAF